MTFFEKILEREGLTKHDLRPLWQYRIEQEDYKALKSEVCEYFKSNSKRNYYRECALLVATWWNLEYKGGVPSAEAILKNIDLGDTQRFIKQFKDDYHKGMRLLDIHPIRINNNQYFRALLVQGGLPINRLTQGEGDLSVYTNYVIKIYQLYNKYGKEQARYRADEYRYLLPQTFRNECIEELTFEICEALKEDKAEYLPFELKGKEEKDFWDTIKREKEKIRQTEEKFHISLKWILLENFETLALSVTVPKYISKEWWEQNLETTIPRIFEILICGRNIVTYKKKGDEKLWRSEYENPIKIDLKKSISCLGTIDGKQIDFQKFVGYPQSLDEPFLLSNAAENECAKLFVPHNYDVGPECKKIRGLICGSVYDFTGKIIVKNNDGVSFDFDSSQPLNEDLFLTTPRLENILDSNIPIIKGAADFLMQERIKNKIQEPENAREGFIRWKFTNNKINYLVPVFQVKKEAKLEIQAKNENCGSIIFKNFGNAKIECNEPHKKSDESNEFCFEFNSAGQDASRPYSISFKISYPDSIEQKARIEVLAPFKGAYFKNPEGKRINVPLCPIKLEGYSLVCIGGKATIKITPTQDNADFRYCKIIEIEDGEYPLNEYRKYIEEALSLSGDRNHSVNFSVEQENKTATKICFRKFNLKVKNNNIENKIIEINKCDAALKTLKIAAFCLTSKICKGEKIECIDLQERGEGTFCFPNEIVGKWIVYNKEQSTLASFMPCLRIFSNEKEQDLNSLEKAISLEDENKRIKEIQEILKNDTDILSEYWKTIIAYAEFFKEEGIPLDTVTYFKAILQNQQLAARFFFAFMLNFGQKDTWFADIRNMVKDQNFDWRFISIKIWKEELCLVRITLSQMDISERVAKVLIEELEKKFREIENEYYKMNSNPKHNKKSFGYLRQRLLTEQQWPTWNLNVHHQYEKYQPNHFRPHERGIFYAPILAAELATGKSNDGWDNKLENYFRFLRCCYTTDSIWFDEAFDFFYNKFLNEIVQEKPKHPSGTFYTVFLKKF